MLEEAVVDHKLVLEQEPAVMAVAVQEAEQVQAQTRQLTPAAVVAVVMVAAEVRVVAAVQAW
jgi:hypothetical protein